MPKKAAPARKRGKLAVKDLPAKTNPKGGLTLATAPTRLTTASPVAATGPTLVAKGGGDVAMEELILSNERVEIP